MKKAFTLAEVLIALTIIGVVAALSIPTLLSSSNATADVTKLQKVYSALDTAVSLYKAENVSLENLFTASGDDASDVLTLNGLAPYLNVIKNCGSGTGCLYTSPVLFLGSGSYESNLEVNWTNKYAKAILADGTIITVDGYSGKCTQDYGDGPLDSNVCGIIDVDLNGAKGPNQIGRDYFVFWIAPTGVYPIGGHNDGQTCNLNSTTQETSYGCTAKVLTEGAINY